jgi:hypothetical protein
VDRHTIEKCLTNFLFKKAIQSWRSFDTPAEEAPQKQPQALPQEPNAHEKIINKIGAAIQHPSGGMATQADIHYYPGNNFEPPKIVVNTAHPNKNRLTYQSASGLRPKTSDMPVRGGSSDEYSTPELMQLTHIIPVKSTKDDPVDLQRIRGVVDQQWGHHIERGIGHHTYNWDNNTGNYVKTASDHSYGREFLPAVVGAIAKNHDRTMAAATKNLEYIQKQKGVPHAIEVEHDIPNNAAIITINHSITNPKFNADLPPSPENTKIRRGKVRIVTPLHPSVRRTIVNNQGEREEAYTPNFSLDGIIDALKKHRVAKTHGTTVRGKINYIQKPRRSEAGWKPVEDEDEGEG